MSRCLQFRMSIVPNGLLQKELSEWFLYATFSVQDPGLDRTIKSQNLEFRTLRERCTRPEGLFSQHRATT